MASRAMYRPIRKAAVDPSADPANAYKTPRRKPNTAPPTRVNTVPGMKATTPAACVSMNTSGAQPPSPRAPARNANKCGALRRAPHKMNAAATIATPMVPALQQTYPISGVARDVKITGLHEVKTDLEGLFMQLTKGEVA